MPTGLRAQFPIALGAAHGISFASQIIFFLRWLWWALRINWNRQPLGRWFNRCGCRFAHVFLGLVIVAASVFKASESARGGGVGTPPLRLLPPGFVVASEFLFGLWMIFGLLPVLTRRLAIGCFCVYACYSVYNAATGERSCGCFGAMSPAPLRTFAFDVAALAALFLLRPDTARTALSGFELGKALGFFTVAVWGGLALMVTVSRPASEKPAEKFRPEDWIGRRLPLLEQIDVGEALATGRWTVVLYRRDCAVCRKEIPRYKEIAGDPAARRVWGRIALIELPPRGEASAEGIARGAPYVIGRLDGASKWSISTPTVVSVVDAIVVPVPREELK